MKIALDPGHGQDNDRLGFWDPGAVSQDGRVREADLALRYCMRAYTAFARAGIPVYITRRTTSDSAPVGRRQLSAVAAGCTHMLSVHFNAAPEPRKGRASGLETLYKTPHSQSLAEKVHRRMVVAFGLPNRGCFVPTRQLAVLGPLLPSALLELGFIDNPEDLAEITRPDGPDRFADALLDLVATNV